MTDRTAPPSLAEDDDEEETLVDVPSSVEDEGAHPVISAEPAPERPLPRSLVGDDDDDETMLLVPGAAPRRAPSEISAGGGALPLAAGRHPAVDDDDDDDATVRLPVPAAMRDGGFRDSLDDAPPIRPLESLPHIGFDDDLDDATLSRPKVVRMTFPADEREAEAAPSAPEPDFSPTDNALRGRSSRREDAAAPLPSDDGPYLDEVHGDEPAPLAEAETGTLVVDAPAEATVFVDGVEQARGTARLEGVDRYARFALRVHCPGFEPWSALVSLNGRPAVKITPTLRRR